MTDVDSVSSVLAQPVVQATGEVAGKISLNFSGSHTHELQGKKSWRCGWIMSSIIKKAAVLQLHSTPTFVFPVSFIL